MVEAATARDAAEQIIGAGLVEGVDGKATVYVKVLVSDIIPSQVSLDQRAGLPTKEELGSVQVVIKRGLNACMVQVVLKQNGQSRELVGKKVTSYAVAETVARVFAATHGVAWEKVEVVSK